jgi:hypothetical protein
MELRRFDIVLWMAWVVAATLGGMAAAIPELRAFGIPFGYPLGTIGSELSFVLVQSFGLAMFQFVVFKVVIRAPTLLAIAWVSITVLASVGDYAATYAAVHSTSVRGPFSLATIEVAMPFAFVVIGGFLLGGVLWAILRVRSALYAWPAAWVIALAVSYATFVWGPALRLLNGVTTLPELLAGDALTGALYGIVTGVALVALTRRSARTPAKEPAPAAR